MPAGAGRRTGAGPSRGGTAPAPRTQEGLALDDAAAPPHQRARDHRDQADGGEHRPKTLTRAAAACFSEDCSARGG